MKTFLSFLLLLLMLLSFFTNFSLQQFENDNNNDKDEDEGDIPTAEYFRLIDDVIEDHNHYVALGFDKNANRSEITTRMIKSSFRKLALEHHPDKQKDNEEELQIFYKINRAQEVLTNEKFRALYDKFLTEGVSWNARYYKRWAYKYTGTDRIPIGYPAILFLIIISGIQYLSNKNKIKRIIKYAKQTEEYKTKLKKHKHEHGEDAELEINLPNVNPYPIIDTLFVRIFVLPYLIFDLIFIQIGYKWLFLQKIKGEEIKVDMDELIKEKFLMSDEELDFKKQQMERKRQRVLKSSKYKKYKRYLKKQQNKK